MCLSCPLNLLLLVLDYDRSPCFNGSRQSKRFHLDECERHVFEPILILCSWCRQLASHRYVRVLFRCSRAAPLRCTFGNPWSKMKEVRKLSFASTAPGEHRRKVSVPPGKWNLCVEAACSYSDAYGAVMAHVIVVRV